MFGALTNVPDDKIHVMGEQTSQALVTCVWSHSVWKVHTVELLTNVASVVVLGASMRETRGMSETSKQVIQ